MENMIEVYLQQYAQLKSMRKAVYEQRKQLRTLESEIQQNLRAMEITKVPVTVVEEEEKKSATLVLTQGSKKEYLSKKNLQVLLERFFTTKFKNTQTAESIKNISIEASTFVWDQRSSSPCVGLTLKMNKRRKLDQAMDSSPSSTSS